MSHIAERMQAVKSRIASAAEAAGCDPSEITVLAVSKTFGIDDIVETETAGQRAFGENYVQEALGKIDALRERTNLEWHLIGPLQSNKCNVVALRFSWVHTVDRLKIAARLSMSRPPSMPPINVCVQVNISGEDSKSGAAHEGVRELVEGIVALPGLRLRGLMGIAGLDIPDGETRAQFRRLRQQFNELRAAGFAIDTLSMGMSADLEAAIAEGATLVRVGTAIFGARDRKTQ